ncbi:MAG: hypothetical protein ACLP2Y_01620 [Limisphaerales bacterium]
MLHQSIAFMARTNIAEAASPYYPPRAGWYSPLFAFGASVRRRLALDRIRLPQRMTVIGLVASFLVPGMGVYLRGPRLWRWAGFAGCGLLMLAFLAGFGYPAGNMAFGLLLSVHVTGFVYYCKPSLVNEPLQSRLAFTLLFLIAIGLLVYLPARSFIQHYWLTPLYVRGNVLIVQRLAGPHDIKRGDWVKYSLKDPTMTEYHGGMVRVQDGYCWGPVLAGAGDRVVFSADSFKVNGEARPLLPHMPGSGEVVVPEKHWFIWPELDISGHGYVGEGAISSTMVQLATVSEKQVVGVGKPFQHWFWRRQMKAIP